MTWTDEQLERFDAVRELEIAVRRADGTLRSWTPIWVVCVGGDVYVRTWYCRTTGGMVSDEAAATTLGQLAE
ncbi:DUF2255 family protein [Gordonia sp. (in: high G+C Gram-positive bacteria)]|uniref:DUF2255 family protein n=1 Tax=Gordonia sp. (in: high G+C Gram-positive bacteria) TaxID=84139 RepID=UPI003F9B280A